MDIYFTLHNSYFGSVSEYENLAHIKLCTGVGLWLHKIAFFYGINGCLFENLEIDIWTILTNFNLCIGKYHYYGQLINFAVICSFHFYGFELGFLKEYTI